METRKESHSDQRPLLLTFAAVCLETLLCAFLLLRIPSDSKHAVVSGMSSGRVMMLGVFGLLFLLNIYCIFIRDQLYELLFSKPWAEKTFAWIAAGSLFLYLLPAYRFGRKAAYYERLQPFFLWFFLAGLSFALFCRWDKDRFAGIRDTFRRFWEEKKLIAIVLAVLVCGIAFVEITGLGKSAEVSLWNKNGIPLQSIQLYSAVVLFILLNKLGVIPFFSKRKRLLNFLLIWAVSALVWSLAPFSEHFFAPGPYDPTGEFYPYSDAVNYEIAAQTALNGWGFNLGRTILKPTVVFIDFLAHLVTGNSYRGSMLLQSGLYAILPAIIYLFGSAIGGCGCGYLAAAFSLLKEWNALNTHTVLTIHSRLTMSEFLIQILLAAFCYTVFRWLKKDGKETLHAAIAGGVLALGMFARYNFMAFLPAALVILLIGYRKEFRKLLKPLLIFFLTVFLTAAPILIRDSVRAGGPFNELFYTVKNVLVGGRFSEPVATVAPTPKKAEVIITETPEISAGPENPLPTAVSGENTQIAPVLTETSVVPGNGEDEINTGQITTELKNNSSIKILPVFWSMMNHGLHNFIASALTIPMDLSFQDLEHLYANEENGLWSDNWDGNFSFGQWILIAVWIVLFAAAGGMLLKRHGIAGFSIFYFWLVYAFSIGFSRSSGGRYVVPCNWIPMLLLAFLCVLLLDRAEIASEPEKVPSAVGWKTALTVFFFTAFFAAMVLFEGLMPARSTSADSGDLAVLKEELSDCTGIDWKLVQAQIKDGTMKLTHGVTLYPRFYYYNDGEHTPNGALMKKDYSRMTFTGINKEKGKRLMQEYMLPQQILIHDFPQDSVFRALSCKSEDGYQDILAVTIETPSGERFTYVRDPLPAFSCPVPDPVCIEIDKCR